MKHLFLCVGFIFPSIALAGSEFQEPLVIKDLWDPPFTVDEAGFADSERFFYTFSEEAGNTLTLWANDEAPHLETKPVAQRDMPMRVVDISATKHGLTVLMSEGPLLRLEMLDNALNSVFEFDGETEGVATGVSVATNNLALIASVLYGGDATEVIEVGNRRGGSLETFIVKSTGLQKVWLDTESNVMIGNSILESRLEAFQNYEGRLETFGYSINRSEAMLLHFAADARHMTAECGLPERPDYPIFVADYSLGMVIAVRFDSFFNTFQLTANLPRRPKISIPVDFPKYENQNFVQPPLLISASCARDRAIVGSINSREITHMTYSNDLELIEVIGTTELPFEPSALALSTQGNMALALARNGQAIAFLSTVNANTNLEADPPKKSIRIGDEDVRNIQRELTLRGFSAGQIDGLYGKRTEGAIQQWEIEKGIKLPRDSYDSMIEIITSY